MDTTTKKLSFIPAPGYVLIDPLEKDEKSSMVKVVDPIDKSYKGIVMAIGDPIPDINGNILKFFAKVGDLVQFSIQGVEMTRLEYKGDLRYEFRMTPYSRVLGII